MFTVKITKEDLVSEERMYPGENEKSLLGRLISYKLREIDVPHEQAFFHAGELFWDQFDLVTREDENDESLVYKLRFK